MPHTALLLNLCTDIHSVCEMIINSWLQLNKEEALKYWSCSLNVHVKWTYGTKGSREWKEQRATVPRWPSSILLRAYTCELNAIFKSKPWKRKCGSIFHSLGGKGTVTRQEKCWARAQKKKKKKKSKNGLSFFSFPFFLSFYFSRCVSRTENRSVSSVKSWFVEVIRFVGDGLKHRRDSVSQKVTIQFIPA